MKSLVLLIAIMTTTNASAFYGKYKFSMLFDRNSESEKVEFLMNSAADVKILENDDYYEVDSYQFFHEVTLSFRSGGDEDYVIATATLVRENGKTVMKNFCAALIDGPNGYASTLGTKTAKLSRWSKSAKEYEQLKLTASEADIAKCESDLLESYIEDGYEVSEY